MENQGSKKMILLVDDSGVMLRSIKEWLGDSYQVFPANSGSMALKFLRSRRPDLVLLDYEMPEMNGAQTLEAMRADPTIPELPVIFLTGKSDEESIQKILDLKTEGYLLKTLPPGEIVKTIDDFFRT